ncbi:MAG: class I SAM-dependent methyltransferase [Marinobacterium sp.]|nr:class I SAM-dependent methyltransferase [Marinobacterium sp.]
MLNYSSASERNRVPIADFLIPLLHEKSVVDVLEIGSGSGQQALYFSQCYVAMKQALLGAGVFADNFASKASNSASKASNSASKASNSASKDRQVLNWQCTEMPENLPSLRQNLQGSGLKAPFELNVQACWPTINVDLLYSSNTLHIMSWLQVQAFFAGADSVVKSGGFLAVYGPFRYNGAFTSQSNAEFDHILRQHNSASGIRDFEQVNLLARKARFSLFADYDLPANNRLLVWQKVGLEVSHG